MEDMTDPLRGGGDGLREDDSDVESFVDAMEDLELREEKPVDFGKNCNDRPFEDRQSDSHSTKSSAMDPGEKTVISDNVNSADVSEGVLIGTKDKDLESSSSSHADSDEVECEKVEEKEIGDIINKALKDDAKSTEEGELLEADNIEISDDIDEEYLRLKQAEMSEEEKEVKKEEAQSLKAEGNERFKAANYIGALESYTEALMICPLCYAKERSIMYSNRAATKYKMEKFDGAIEDSSKALELNPNYLKALLRRAELYEKTEKLDEALKDYEKCLEMDPSLTQARAACMTLPDRIKERNEKMKEEMMGKLKDLGNMILRPFGLSTNNFQLQQDPNTGSYSVQFNQNAQH